MRVKKTLSPAHCLDFPIIIHRFHEFSSSFSRKEQRRHTELTDKKNTNNATNLQRQMNGNEI